MLPVFFKSVNGGGGGKVAASHPSGGEDGEDPVITELFINMPFDSKVLQEHQKEK